MASDFEELRRHILQIATNLEYVADRNEARIASKEDLDWREYSLAYAAYMRGVAQDLRKLAKGVTNE